MKFNSIDNGPETRAMNASRVIYHSDPDSERRTVESKLGDIVSIKDRGAVGDGVTDDTDAIDAALAVTGSPYIPDGLFSYTGDIDALFDRKPFGPGFLQYSGYVYRAQREPVANTLWPGDFVTWTMGHALSVNAVQRVQIPAGVTHARSGRATGTTVYHVDRAQTENAIRVQRRASDTSEATHVMVINLSQTETNPIRGRRCVVELNGLRSATYTGGPIAVRVQASPEPEQPILRADGYYTNGNETLASFDIDLGLDSRPRNAPFFTVVDVPADVVQVAVVVSIGFSGVAPDEDYIELDWVRMYPGESVEKTTELSLHKQLAQAASRYQTSYPYGVPRGAITRQGAVSAVAVTTASNWSFSIPIRFSHPMVVPPQFIFQQPLSGTESRLLDVNDNTFISGVACDLSDRGAVITNNQSAIPGHRYLCHWTASVIF